VRVAVDDRSESIGKKIRDSSIGRYPYMLVVGRREEETGTIAVRSHEDGDLGEMTAEQFAARSAPRPASAKGSEISACQPWRLLYTPRT